MKKNEEKNVIKELDKIYGIEDSKWEILNYVKYLGISKENHFANYNIIIHNNSSYPSETKIKLINFLRDMLKKNNIISTDYEFINSNEMRKFEKINEKDCEDDEDDNKKVKKSKTNKKVPKCDEVNLKSDLIIIDSEKIGRNLENYREEIITMMEKFSNKVYIIIDKSFCVGEVNASFNQYFDWFFEIDKISSSNKKDYTTKLLTENNIKMKNKCDYIDDLMEEPFYRVKTQMNNIILQCKINNIDEITDDVVKKYVENNKDELKRKNDKYERTGSKNLDFNSLVGIEGIKDEINKIVNYVKICKRRKGNMPTLHMCFTGNPGTGKTTVARIIGQIFKEEKILSRGEFVEIHGRDLIGKYVGWTAKEVKDCVNRARGGVLFIDEAYSLNADRRGSFEDEAIATLIKEMEDKRDDLCIILAGYKDEMNDLIKRNPGFESRIQFYIDFPNYNEEELYEIFKGLTKKEGYKISNQVKDILLENFKQMNSNETFSNGRYVRNLYEKAKIEQANRVSLDENEDINIIKKCDVENVLENVKEVKVQKVKIGFTA